MGVPHYPISVHPLSAPAAQHPNFLLPALAFVGQHQFAPPLRSSRSCQPVSDPVTPTAIASFPRTVCVWASAKVTPEFPAHTDTWGLVGSWGLPACILKIIWGRLNFHKHYTLSFGSRCPSEPQPSSRCPLLWSACPGLVPGRKPWSFPALQSGISQKHYSPASSLEGISLAEPPLRWEWAQNLAPQCRDSEPRSTVP